MTKSQYNRRNFLSCIAILSAGTALGSAVKPFYTKNKEESLDKKWSAFWKNSGGHTFNELIDSKQHNSIIETKGHLYENGEIILFSKENILALPTWIYWGGDKTNPADVIITLFENNDSLKKITRLNRFEMGAVYKLSKEYKDDQLLVVHHNNIKPFSGNTTSFIQNKTFINRHSNTQQVSYYKEQELVFHKKFIYHA